MTAVLRADMPAAQLERVRRRDREATRRRRVIARGLPDPGPIPDVCMVDRRLRLPSGLPVHEETYGQPGSAPGLQDPVGFTDPSGGS